MELGGWGTNLAPAFHLVHFIALRDNYNHKKYNLEPIILQLGTLFPLDSYYWQKNLPLKTTVNSVIKVYLTLRAR